MTLPIIAGDDNDDSGNSDTGEEPRPPCTPARPMRDPAPASSCQERDRDDDEETPWRAGAGGRCAVFLVSLVPLPPSLLLPLLLRGRVKMTIVRSRRPHARATGAPSCPGSRLPVLPLLLPLLSAAEEGRKQRRQRRQPPAAVGSRRTQPRRLAQRLQVRRRLTAESELAHTSYTFTFVHVEES
jgi:hypothetical protein